MTLPPASNTASTLEVGMPEIEAVSRGLEDPELGVDSFMVIYGGRIIFKRWWRGCAPDMPHEMYSVTKTVTAIAIGIATDEGLLNVDEPVVDFFGQEASGVDEKITLHHLLTMSSGRVAADSSARFLTSEQAIQRFAGLEQHTEPGSTFGYCSLSSHILTLALRSRTGVTLLEYVLPRLFRPLEIHTPAWETDLEGNQLGGSGLFLTTEQLARIGMLFLGRGTFNGKRIFSEEWHYFATAAQVITGLANEARIEWRQGYGYQMWLGTHNTYRADGMLGQFAVVVPEKGMVIAVTARSQHTDRVLALIEQLVR